MYKAAEVTFVVSFEFHTTSLLLLHMRVYSYNKLLNYIPYEGVATHTIGLVEQLLGGPGASILIVVDML